MNSRDETAEGRGAVDERDAGTAGRRRGVLSRLAGGIALLLSAGGVFYAGWVAGRAINTGFRILGADDPPSAMRQAMRFRNTADGPVRDGFGLTYIGYPGVAWAFSQAALLVLGVALCFASSRNVRRAGVALTVIGSFIWLGNMAYFAVVADALLFLGLMPVHAMGFALVLVFAWRRLRAR